MASPRKVLALRQPDTTRPRRAAKAAPAKSSEPKVGEPGENPLLPHQKLREIHALMLQCQRLARKLPPEHAGREAFLAAAIIHLGAGDLLSAAPEDLVAAKLASEGKFQSLVGASAGPAKLASTLLLSAAAARGMQARGPGQLVLSLARAGTSETDWSASLAWAQEASLPVIFACSDATGGRRVHRGRPSQHLLDFALIGRLAKKAKIPLFTVDGEDAVAVYRVMQECTLRARHGGGPALIWAVLRRPSWPATRLISPVQRLERYMALRKIRP